MRYFMDLAYCGGAFHGWQIQPGDSSVQETIERALGILTGAERVEITGAGRTDAGVNARRMIAHVDLPDDINPNSTRFLHSLNGICGRDIAIYSFTAVPSDAHARFDATERTYRYFAHTSLDVFAGREGLSWYVPNGLDFEAMNRAGALLLGRRDFTSFSRLHTDVKTNICDLRQAQWKRIEDEDGYQWYFEITADRFLRNMVRAIVGTLAIIGRGKMAPEGIMDVLDAKNRSVAGSSAPGEPLFLWDIKYPFYTPPKRI